MSERQGDVRPRGPTEAPTVEIVVHKAARDCPMIEPHPRAICGIARVRERSQVAEDEAAQALHSNY